MELPCLNPSNTARALKPHCSYPHRVAGLPPPNPLLSSQEMEKKRRRA